MSHAIFVAFAVLALLGCLTMVALTASTGPVLPLIWAVSAAMWGGTLTLSIVDY